MKKNFFVALDDIENNRLIEYTSNEDAEKNAKLLANKYNKNAFIMQTTAVVVPDEINIKVNSFETALKYLGGRRACMCGIFDKHAKALNALYKLITIAEAWNLADNFVPDFTNHDQYKYFPWFAYKNNTAGFGYVATYYAATYTCTHVGSRLCFKTEERAEQFGKQFIELWNDFLLSH